MLKRRIINLNGRLSRAGLPLPTQLLWRAGLRTHVEVALDSLGVREYSTIRFPVNGSSFDVTVNSSRFWDKLERREFEANCFTHLSDVVEEGSKVLDVGAGLGSYSILFSKLAGERGKVHAFEPDPVARRVLRDNLRKNRLANVRVEDSCISDAPGRAILRSWRWGTGLSTIVPRFGGEAPLKLPVDSTTVDRFCADNSFRPDGLKIDVEGAEGLVLLGSRKTIRDARPWMLIEFHSGPMTPEERATTWRLATESAKEVVYLDGDSRLLSPGDNITSMPEGRGFHIFVRN